MLMPLLAAFRSNVYYDATTSKVGWCCDNVKLFKDYNKELCDKLKQSFKAGGNDVNRLSKDPTIWENLFMRLQNHVDAATTGASFTPYKVYPL